LLQRSRKLLGVAGPVMAVLVWVFSISAAASVFGDFANQAELDRLAAQADSRFHVLAIFAVSSLVAAIAAAALNWRTSRISSLTTIGLLVLFVLFAGVLATSHG
jgi:hypothetical protein